MADMNFNTTSGDCSRELLIAYLNTGRIRYAGLSPVGKRVEDSSEEFDWGEGNQKDIFGNTYTTLKKPTITQTFDPCGVGCRRCCAEEDLESRNQGTERPGAGEHGHADCTPVRWDS